MKLFARLFIAAFVLFVASCVNDSQTETVSVDDTGKVSFVASFDDSATKTSIDPATGKVSWKHGDIIHYITDSNPSRSLTIDSVLDDGSAVIQFDVSSTDNTLIAVYGAEGIDRTNGLRLIGTSFFYEQSGLFQDSHTAIAIVSKTDGVWPTNIVFRNISSCLSFELGDVANEYDSAYLLLKGGLNASFAPLEGDSVDMIVEYFPNGEISIGNDYYTTTSVPYIQIPISGPGVYYFSLAPFSSAQGFSLYFRKNGRNMAVVDSDNSLFFERKKLIKLGNLDNRIRTIFNQKIHISEASFLCLCDTEPDPNYDIDLYDIWDQYNYKQKTETGALAQLVALAMGMDWGYLRRFYGHEEYRTYVEENGHMRPTDDYGRIIFLKDTDAYGEHVENDKLVVLFRKKNYDKLLADKIKEKELYTHFMSDFGDDLWLGIKVSIVDKPSVSFSEKNIKYWFNDLVNDKGYEQNLRLNVKVPDSADDDVADCHMFFDYCWRYEKVVINLESDATSNLYENYWADMPVGYDYVFSKSQDEFKYTLDGVAKVAKFYVSDDQKTIYLDAAHQHPLARITEEEFMNNCNSCKITYLFNNDTKELLNAYIFKSGIIGDSDPNKVSEMLFFMIDLNAYYGECHIPCGTHTFPIRLIPPLAIKAGEKAVFNEAADNGDEIDAGKLFSIYDWKGSNVFVYKYDRYVEDVYHTEDLSFDGVSYYNYYGITNLHLDLQKVKTDQTGRYEYLFDRYVNGRRVSEGINNSAMLWLADKANPQLPVDSYLDVSNSANILNYILHFENPYPSDHDYHLLIPCTISYRWGDLHVDLEVPVIHNSSMN